MKEDFSPITVPNNYAYCFNHQCVKIDKCLRYLATQFSDPLRSTVHTVNPAWIPEDTDTCSLFQPIRKVRIAWGIKNLLNRVPHEDAILLKPRIINYFGKTQYYRLYRKEYGLTPEQQDFIRQLFRSRGIAEEPDFEYYTEVYQWY